MYCPKLQDELDNDNDGNNDEEGAPCLQEAAKGDPLAAEQHPEAQRDHVPAR